MITMFCSTPRMCGIPRCLISSSYHARHFSRGLFSPLCILSAAVGSPVGGIVLDGNAMGCTPASITGGDLGCGMEDERQEDRYAGWKNVHRALS